MSIAVSPLVEPPLLAEDRPVRLGPEANGIRMSPEEFDAWPQEDCDPGFQYELIRGVLVVNPIPVEAEGDPNEELGHWLRSYQDLHPNGRSVDKTLAERYVHLPDGSRRKADRLIWCGLGRLPKPKVDVPRIIAEFVSRRRRDWRRDYIDKRREYQAAGVTEYWVIDRFRRQMTVFFADGTERVVAESETYETPLLPGFRLALGRLFAIADQWAESDEA